MAEEFTLARAVDWLQGARYKGEKKGLSNTRALLDELGAPEKNLKMIHVAGTNGKGSVCAFIERALRECGYKTGLYTSPYLIEYAERVRVNGAPEGDAELLQAILDVKAAAERLVARGICPTTFELGTALAFLVFARERVDYAIIEVGLGGRLDSTNVITPVVSAIAAIGFDHMKILGDTLPEIAREKAGIIKPGVPVAIHPSNASVLDVFEAAAKSAGSALKFVSDVRVITETARGGSFEVFGREFEISLPGRHQLDNAALAVATLMEIKGLDWERVRLGLKKTVWHARLEWVDGVLIDGAHNPQGASTLAAYLNRFVPGEKTFVFGMMRDKQLRSCASIIERVATRVIATAVDEPRAAAPEEIAACFACARPVNGVAEALRAARASGGSVIVCGSLYLAGEARSVLRPGERLCL